MKIHNSWGELTHILAKKEALAVSDEGRANKEAHLAQEEAMEARIVHGRAMARGGLLISCPDSMVLLIVILYTGNICYNGWSSHHILHT